MRTCVEYLDVETGPSVLQCMIMKLVRNGMSKRRKATKWYGMWKTELKNELKPALESWS